MEKYGQTRCPSTFEVRCCCTTAAQSRCDCAWADTAVYGFEPKGTLMSRYQLHTVVVRREPSRAKGSSLRLAALGSTAVRFVPDTHAYRVDNKGFRTRLGYPHSPPKDTACRLLSIRRSSFPQTVNGKRFGGNSARPGGADQSKPMPP